MEGLKKFEVAQKRDNRGGGAGVGVGTLSRGKARWLNSVATMSGKKPRADQFYLHIFIIQHVHFLNLKVTRLWRPYPFVPQNVRQHQRRRALNYPSHRTHLWSSPPNPTFQFRKSITLSHRISMIVIYAAVEPVESGSDP